MSNVDTQEFNEGQVELTQSFTIHDGISRMGYSEPRAACARLAVNADPCIKMGARASFSATIAAYFEQPVKLNLHLNPRHGVLGTHAGSDRDVAG